MSESLSTNGPPTWSLAGFHGRVQMAKDYHLFIITEGIDTDPYFYDCIAKTSSQRRVQSAKTYTVGQINREVTSSADAKNGKAAVIDAYIATRDAGALTAMNSKGRRSIVFCVDRDLDKRHETLETEMHFCVTKLRDPEAEIFGNADLPKALQHLLSLDYPDAKRRASTLAGWIEDLASTWKEWILLSTIAINAPKSPTGKWSGPSPVNQPWNSSTDKAKLRGYEAKVRQALDSDSAFANAKRDANALLRARSLLDKRASVKGKWLTQWLAVQLSNSNREKTQIQKSALVAFAGTLEYSAPWADHYRQKFEEAMSRRRRPFSTSS